VIVKFETFFNMGIQLKNLTCLTKIVISHLETRQIMNSYALTLVKPETTEIFEKISRVVCNMQEVNFGGLIDKWGDPVALSCHILARACSRVFRIPYCDGSFYCSFRHSWLSCEGDVIDVYPVGVLTQKLIIEPLLVQKDVARWLYEANKKGRNVWDEEKQKMKWG